MCAEASEDDDYVQVPRVSDATASMAGRSSRRWPLRADNDYGSAAQPLGVDAAILRAGKLSLRAVTLALVCAALAVMTLSSTERLGHPGGSGWQLSFGSGVLELVDDMCHEKQTSGLLILVPCPTFMTLLRSQNYHGETPKAAKMDAPKVEAKVERWRIVFKGEVKVRGEPSFQGFIKGTKKKCATFLGSLNNGWIKLPHNAGYVRQHIGDTQIAVAVHPGQSPGDCARKFRVVFNGRVKIRSQPSFQASITGRKWKCQIFEGETEDGGWIRLPGNSGFVRSHIGDTTLVEELKDGASSKTCEPLIRLWRIIFQGHVKIRKQPSFSAPVAGTKWKCSKFAGQMEDGWIKLTENRGYIKASIGPTKLAEEVRVGQNPCIPLARQQAI